MTKKKLIQNPLFLPLVCVVLVLAVNVVYDIAQGNAFYDFFRITMQASASGEQLLSGRLVTILNRGSEVAILAIGMTLVVSASAGTDISVGSVMSLCASFCCMLVAGFGVSAVNDPSEFAMPLIVGLIGALVMGCVCGAFNGALVAYLNIQPMVATLILWSAARAIGLLLCKSKNKVVAEYALRDNARPIGVAEYQLVESLPAELQTSLPSIEQIERELASDDASMDDDSQ